MKKSTKLTLSVAVLIACCSLGLLLARGGHGGGGRGGHGGRGGRGGHSRGYGGRGFRGGRGYYGGYRGWGWMSLGAAGALLFLDPLWYRGRAWDWPEDGINVTINNTPYVIPNQVSTADLNAALAKAERQSNDMREDFKIMKKEQERLKEQLDTAASIKVEEKLSALEEKMDELARNIKRMDTKVVGPIATKLHKYTPSQQAKVPGEEAY